MLNCRILNIFLFLTFMWHARQYVRSLFSRSCSAYYTHINYRQSVTVLQADGAYNSGRCDTKEKYVIAVACSLAYAHSILYLLSMYHIHVACHYCLICSWVCVCVCIHTNLLWRYKSDCTLASCVRILILTLYACTRGHE